MKPVRIIRHASEESLGTLEPTLRAGELALDVVDCFAPSWPVVEQRGFAPSQFSGLVVMGGPMNVDETEKHPFLATELAWLRLAVAASLPTLGICLGGQLLARALGARVVRNPVKEIGWHQIDLLDAARDDPLLQHAGPRQTVFQWHGDTFELPGGAVHLARSAACPQQAFRYGVAAWGLQFHPEMTAQMVVDWLTEPPLCADVAADRSIDPEAIRKRTPSAMAEMTPFTQKLFGEFAARCREEAR
jgi:GMP synthase (glutamine-hydrolysing)